MITLNAQNAAVKANPATEEAAADIRYINAFYRASSGKRHSVGSIKLKMSDPSHAKIIAVLDAKPEKVNDFFKKVTATFNETEAGTYINYFINYDDGVAVQEGYGLLAETNPTIVEFLLACDTDEKLNAMLPQLELMYNSAEKKERSLTF